MKQIMASSKIHQLQAAYAPIQDRVLLRINTSGKMEFRFWLTRRFVQHLWPALQSALELQPQLTAVDTQARAAVLEFMHQNATAKADFNAPFEATTETITPLGQEPILAAQARIELVAENDQLRLFTLHPEKGQGIEVAMDMQLMHAFCKLLADAVIAADWNLDLGFARPQLQQTVLPSDGQLLH